MRKFSSKFKNWLIRLGKRDAISRMTPSPARERLVNEEAYRLRRDHRRVHYLCASARARQRRVYAIARLYQLFLRSVERIEFRLFQWVRLVRQSAGKHANDDRAIQEWLLHRVRSRRAMGLHPGQDHDSER